MKMRSVAIIAAGAMLWLAAAGASAVMTAEEMARLDKDLTPLGAERAGNKDGSIPAWTGGLTKPPAGFNGTNYVDPFANEKPLFTITAENLDKYKDKVPAGQLAMFKKYPKTFKMNVYPTHRTAGYPQEVYDRINKFTKDAQLSESTYALIKGAASPAPFPIPKKAEEIMWNSNARWIGGSYDRFWDIIPVSPTGEFYNSRVHEQMWSIPHGYVEGKTNPGEGWRYLLHYLSPATLEGLIYLLWEPIDFDSGTRQGWTYNVGQRRVRRAPDVAYDAAPEGTEGLWAADGGEGWSGSIDRYEWKLLGKREMYIAYNSYKLADKKNKYSDIFRPGHLNPDLVRYELHRVWVVEANLKKGQRHIYPRATFYIDEDTWQVATKDMYDARGQLWRVLEVHAVQFYDAMVPRFHDVMVYDLDSGAQLASYISNEIPGIWKFGKKAKAEDLTPDSLRRIGTK